MVNPQPSTHCIATFAGVSHIGCSRAQAEFGIDAAPPTRRNARANLGGDRSAQPILPADRLVGRHAARP